MGGAFRFVGSVGAVVSPVGCAVWVGAVASADRYRLVPVDVVNLQAAIAGRLSGRDRRPDHFDREHDRGVITERSIWVVPSTGIDWPHAAQVFLLRREVLDVCQARISREFVFGITSRPAEHIDPVGLNTAVRSHWGIENSEHLVRDVTFGEDAHQAYIGATPQVMATLRNLAMSVIRLAGSNEIKRTLQYIRRDRTRALHLVGLS